MVALTIGMATYNDFDGAYFTIQALRLYQELADSELLVIDNFGCTHTRSFVEGLPEARYILATDIQGTATPRDLIFREARGEAVLCLDSHVLLEAGAISRLRSYYQQHPDTPDLLQGPLVYDDLQTISTHFDPVWREQMWGVWATDPRGLDPTGEPFEISMQGLGVFSCRKAAWPGFNPAFRGFGGEEGYIHEKVRQRGGRCLCLPWLRWMHRFVRPAGVPYRLTIEDKFRNYVIGHAELGLDLEPVTSHFAAYLPEERLQAITKSAMHDQHIASLPLVSGICATYNRPPTHQHLIEEAIESFLRQTYPNKELIVINDCPGQELVCNAPGVRVVNVPERFSSLGEKYNAALALARGELIAPWEDDDISLPWRLTLSVERLGAAGYFNPRCYWFLDGRGLHADHLMGYGHNLSLFTREALTAVGGCPPISVALDAAMDASLRRMTTVEDNGYADGDALPRHEWFYIYRWGVSPHHLSGSNEPDHWQRIGERPVQTGRFVLQPHWRQDYALEVRKMASSDTENDSDSKDSAQPRQAVVFIAGDSPHWRHPAARDFPLLMRSASELAPRHLDRVMRAIDDAVIAGGTHLLVPRYAADWLGDHPLLVDYFTAYHELVEWSESLGLVFELRRSLTPNPLSHSDGREGC